MMRLTRSLVLLAALALFLPAAANADPTPPEQLAHQTVHKLLASMKGRRDELRKHPQQLYKLLDNELVPLIDLDYMSRLVLGRYWRTASAEQRKRFETAFKNMLIHTYGSALLDFHNSDRIKYLPVHAPKDAKRVTFRAVVQSDNGQDIPISLKMHLVDGQWKVYDGTAGNLSFVTNYRGQFNAQIQHGGLDKLISRMEQRYNPDPSD